jgi:hypothetical protein
MAPDRPDENTDIEKENKEKYDDNDPPVSDRYPVTNVGTSTDVGSYRRQFTIHHWKYNNR